MVNRSDVKTGWVLSSQADEIINYVSKSTQWKADENKTSLEFHKHKMRVVYGNIIYNFHKCTDNITK